MANSTLLTLLLVVLFVDGIGFLGQIAVNNVGLTSTASFGGGTAGILESYKTNGTYVIDPSNPQLDLTSEGAKVQATGNVISDTFSSALQWIKNKTSAGWNYFVMAISGPVPYIENMGLPSQFIFIIGAIWYALTVFLFVAFTIGRTWV